MSFYDIISIIGAFVFFSIIIVPFVLSVISLLIEKAIDIFKPNLKAPDLMFVTNFGFFRKFLGLPRARYDLCFIIVPLDDDCQRNDTSSSQQKKKKK